MPRVQMTKKTRIALSVLMVYIIALIVLIVVRFIQSV
jgi:hypothetical protein